MQFALGILEERVSAQDQPYVQDVKEEVELMSKLVGELLTYSKVGIQAPHIKLEQVRLRPLIEQVVVRETTNHEADVRLDIDEDIIASAQPELLVRAVGNVVRNAVRYAGHAGPITITAKKNGEKNSGGLIHLTIADHGSGVPEDALDNLFDPFYRIETDRARETGGSGLGLAIVKTCVEACGGTVTARNLSPHGLEVSISLQP
jgi:two-component system sensor histidine kinase CpxA